MEKENTYFSNPDDQGVRYYQSDNPTVAVKTVERKKRPLLHSLIVLAIILGVIILLGVACSSIFEGGTQEIILPSSSYIAVLYIEGALMRSNFDSWGSPVGYQHQWTLDQIYRLINDSNNRGLILLVDSPGGSVYAIDELHLMIREYQLQTGRPVYVSMASIAASGGYYISASADRIYANRNGLTGSIGVTMGTFIDLSEFLDSHGVRTTTIDSGRNKSMGNMFDPLTQEQQNILQSIVDEAFYQFVDIIMEGRNMDFDSVMSFADGRIFTAQQALEHGMIDEIGTFDDVLCSMRNTHNLHHATIVDIRHTYRSFLSSLLGAFDNNVNISTGGDVSAMLDFAERQNNFPLSYLCLVLSNY